MLEMDTKREFGSVGLGDYIAQFGDWLYLLAEFQNIFVNFFLKNLDFI